MTGPSHLADPLPCRAGPVMLRRLGAADLPAFQAYRNDPVVGQYQGWSAMSDAEALRFLVEMNGTELLQPGAWSQIAIADSGDSALLGDIGMLLGSDGNEVEIGFTLAPAAQGRGWGTAAVRAALALAWAHTRADRVLAITDARNLPSVRLLERAGLQRIGSHRAMFRGAACVEHAYAITRHDVERGELIRRQHANP